jgi:hypothetical protein
MFCDIFNLSFNLLAINFPAGLLMVIQWLPLMPALPAAAATTVQRVEITRIREEKWSFF